MRSFICSLIACLTALCTGGGGDHDTDVIDTDTDTDVADTDRPHTGDTDSSTNETGDTGEVPEIDLVCYNYVNNCPAGTPNSLEFEPVNWWEPQHVDTGISNIDTGLENTGDTGAWTVDTASNTGSYGSPSSILPGDQGLPIDFTASWGQQVPVLKFRTRTQCLSAEVDRIRVEVIEGHELVRWLNLIYTDAETCEIVRSDDYILAPITTYPYQNNWSAIFQVPVFAGGGATVAFEAQLIDQAPFAPSAAAGPGPVQQHVVQALIHFAPAELPFTWSDGSSPLPGERSLIVGMFGPRIAVE